MITDAERMERTLRNHGLLPKERMCRDCGMYREWHEPPFPTDHEYVAERVDPVALAVMREFRGWS